MIGPGGAAPTRKIILAGLWRDNPIFKQVLGICSTLAVTNLELNTVVMCVALVFTIALSSASVSLLRSVTPRNIRMMVETLIIAFYVIIVDILLKAYWPEMSANLGPYVGLIITNCILMGRLEAFASKNPPLDSVVDGIGAGIGYTLVMLALSFVRELFGFGTLFGIRIFGSWWTNWSIMVMAPSAFFLLALLIWIVNTKYYKAG